MIRAALLALALLFLPAAGLCLDGPADQSVVRFQVKPSRSTLISSEMAGRISELPLRDGDRVTQGQTLVRFNCASENSQLARARAVHDKRTKIYEVNANLHKLQSLSALELAVSKAEVAEAAAEVQVMQAQVARCAIAAQFPGRVSEVHVRQYQYVPEGQPILEIIDDRDLEIEFIVPSRWLVWLKSGHRFTAEIDETGRGCAAEVTRLGGKVDPVSQSVKVYAKILDKTGDLLSGMSGQARITSK